VNVSVLATDITNWFTDTRKSDTDVSTILDVSATSSRPDTDSNVVVVKRSSLDRVARSCVNEYTPLSRPTLLPVDRRSSSAALSTVRSVTPTRSPITTSSAAARVNTDGSTTWVMSRTV
jgi:hypothetical protein